MGGRYKISKQDQEKIESYFGGKAKMKKLLAASHNIPFTRFHKSWSKNNILSHWRGDTWDQVIDFCSLVGIPPKKVMNYVAGLKINKTDLKTIQIADLINSSTSKLSLRGKAINLSKKLIEIDIKLKQGDKESLKHWQDRIYRKVYKSLKRYNL